MGDLRRTIRCSNCNNEATVNVNSELDLRELLVSGKCRQCGSAMQVSYSVVEPQTESQADDSSDMVNVDDALLSAEMPSDTLKDIMED